MVKLTEELGFIKFNLKEPQIGIRVAVPFTLQDPSERNEIESCKLLTRNLQKHLFYTNWRIQSSQTFYRLGFISGQLTAYDSEEDLLKIGKEITDSENKRKK